MAHEVQETLIGLTPRPHARFRFHLKTQLFLYGYDISDENDQ